MSNTLSDWKALSGEKPKYLKWGDFKSTDENNPDVLEIECGKSTDTFETEYSTCIKAKMNNEDINIPLKGKNSNNPQPLQAYRKYVASGKIKAGQLFKLLTFKGTSQNDKPIRRFSFVFFPIENDKQSSLFYGNDKTCLRCYFSNTRIEKERVSDTIYGCWNCDCVFYETHGGMKDVI